MNIYIITKCIVTTKVFFFQCKVSKFFYSGCNFQFPLIKTVNNFMSMMKLGENPLPKNWSKEIELKIESIFVHNLNDATKITMYYFSWLENNFTVTDTITSLIRKFIYHKFHK